jgi:hypothetical protein
MKQQPFPVKIKSERLAVVDSQRREYAPTVEQAGKGWGDL